MPFYKEYQIVGTVRSPDGDQFARIDGLVRAGSPQPEIISLRESIRLASLHLLWVRSEVTGEHVLVEPYDSDGDGVADSVRTRPDRTGTNNLLFLQIWDRVRRTWVIPSRRAG